MHLLPAIIGFLPIDHQFVGFDITSTPRPHTRRCISIGFQFGQLNDRFQFNPYITSFGIRFDQTCTRGFVLRIPIDRDIEIDKINKDYEVKKSNADANANYNNQKLELDKKRIELEKLQLTDDNKMNDEVQNS